VMEFRVAPNFASFSTSGAQAMGCPTASLFQLRLSTSRRVTLASASSGLAGDGSSSCLESRILQHIQRISSELPRSFALLVAPVDDFPSFPGSCIFRLYRRRKFESPRISRPSAPLVAGTLGFPWAPSTSCASRCGCELPRALHLRALPAMDLRVASNFASFSTSSAQASSYPAALLFRLCLPMSRWVAPASASSGLAGDGSPGCPESRILQHIQRSSSELPRNFASLVAPADESPGYPGFCIFRLCRRRNLRVAPNLASFGASGAGASGFPSALLIQMRLPVWLRVAPRPAPSGFASVPSFRVTPNPLSLGAG
jgi:hypothetical protein